MAPGPLRRACAAIATFAAALPGALPASARADDAQFFDDFAYVDVAALVAGGWTVRTAVGHPGIPGAAWGPGSVSMADDEDDDDTGAPTGGAPAGRAPPRRLLRLTAVTDGTPEGTRQAQVCHHRKLLVGTYAARLRFRDDPASGIDGDPVIQSFYAVGELRFPFDPTFSEVDWEYLANGGWGAPQTRLYGLSWQTVQVEPWVAFNTPHEEFGSHAGWHQLTMQVEPARVRLFVDGALVSTPEGRDVPVTPMALAFNLWFSPGGLLPPSAVPRVWQEDVDWVLHVAGRSLAPAEMAGRVEALRARGVAREDTVPEPEPPLPFRCDM